MSLQPFYHPTLTSKLLLDGVFSPGTCTLSGHDRNEDWKITKPTDASGASTKYGGSEVAQFQVSFYLADQDDYLAWPAFQRLLESSVRGPKPKALSIFHPALTANGIAAVSLMSMGGMVYDDRGGATVLVKLLEFNPPRPKPPASAAAKGGSSAGTGSSAEKQQNDPNAAAKQELAELLDEAATA